MADEKVSALTELLAPISSDVLYVVDDPAGTPLSRKATIANVLGVYDSITATLTNKSIDAAQLTGTIATARLPTGIDAANISAGSVSNTEFDFLNGVSSNIQTQLDAKAASNHTHLLAAGATDVTITAANLNALDDGVDTSLHFHDADRARANHTGTQAFSTITGTVPIAQGGTNITTYTAGDMLYASATNVLSKLAIGTNGFVLKISGGVPTWTAEGGGSSHDLLSATHTDVAASSVSRGSIIVGNSTPAWAELALGAASTFLQSDGTDLAYVAMSGDATLSAGALTIAADAITTSKILDDAVTYAKMQNISATDRILGRDSSGAGIVEEITPTSLRTMINVEDGATADQSDAEIETAYNNQVAVMSQAAAETGTSTTSERVTPQRLSQAAEASRKDVQILVVERATAVAVAATGVVDFHISPLLAGMDLVYVHAEVITAGTTGTTDIQVHNVTQAADMLSTGITIDSGETGSDTAATPPVIDTANDDVAENDVLRIDVDAISTTPPQGLIVTLGFRKP